MDQSEIIALGTPKPKINSLDVVYDVLKKAKKPLPYGEISIRSGINSGGHLSNLIKILINNGKVTKFSCPVCEGCQVYEAVK